MDDETLLVEEYNQYSEAFWRNEEIGEKRLTFFTTLTTGLITAVVALRTGVLGIPPTETLQLATAALGGALAFGVVTFLRVLHRDRVTDEYKAIIDYVRQEMLQRAVSLDGYTLPRAGPRHWTLRGGLALTVALMNCALLSLLVALWSADYPARWWLIADVVLAFFVLQGWAIGTRAIQQKKLKQQVKENKTAPTERSQTFRAGVGAAILNRDGRVLALKRKDVPAAWQMPQGGIEPGESPEEAVRREIEEETGIPQGALELVTPVKQLLAYELPEKHRSGKTGRGQVQYWFVFRFTGEESDITLGDQKEFSASEWVAMKNLVQRVVAFKRPVYEAVATELESLSPRH